MEIKKKMWKPVRISIYLSVLFLILSVAAIMISVFGVNYFSSICKIKKILQLFHGKITYFIAK